MKNVICFKCRGVLTLAIFICIFFIVSCNSKEAIEIEEKNISNEVDDGITDNSDEVAEETQESNMENTEEDEVIGQEEDTLDYGYIYLRVLPTGLNVRLDHSVDSDIVGRVFQNEKYMFMESSIGVEGYEWYKISYIDSDEKEIIGWVRGDFCLLFDEQGYTYSEGVATDVLFADVIYTKDKAFMTYGSTNFYREYPLSRARENEYDYYIRVNDYTEETTFFEELFVPDYYETGQGGFISNGQYWDLGEYKNFIEKIPEKVNHLEYNEDYLVFTTVENQLIALDKEDYSLVFKQDEISRNTVFSVNGQYLSYFFGDDFYVINLENGTTHMSSNMKKTRNFGILDDVVYFIADEYLHYVEISSIKTADEKSVKTSYKTDSLLIYKDRLFFATVDYQMVILYELVDGQISPKTFLEATQVNNMFIHNDKLKFKSGTGIYFDRKECIHEIALDKTFGIDKLVYEDENIIVYNYYMDSYDEPDIPIVLFDKESQSLTYITIGDFTGVNKLKKNNEIIYQIFQYYFFGENADVWNYNFSNKVLENHKELEGEWFYISDNRDIGLMASWVDGYENQVINVIDLISFDTNTVLGFNGFILNNDNPAYYIDLENNLIRWDIELDTKDVVKTNVDYLQKLYDEDYNYINFQYKTDGEWFDYQGE